MFRDQCIAKELVFEALWYCLTRIYNSGTSLVLRFLCSWLNAGMIVLAHELLKLSLIVPRNSGNRANPKKLQSIRNYS